MERNKNLLYCSLFCSRSSLILTNVFGNKKGQKLAEAVLNNFTGLSNLHNKFYE